jgi:hypothetical protein
VKQEQSEVSEREQEESVSERAGGEERKEQGERKERGSTLLHSTVRDRSILPALNIWQLTGFSTPGIISLSPSSSFFSSQSLVLPKKKRQPLL